MQTSILKKRISIIVTAVIFLIGVAMLLYAALGDVVKHCRDFKTQGEAQKYFEKNPKRARHLDRDSDGRACDGLPVKLLK